MRKAGASWLAGTLALAAYAALFLGNCGGESLNGSGTGGTTGKGGNVAPSGAGGFLDGSGGLTGTGDTLGTGGLASGGIGGDGIGAGGDIGNCNVIIMYPPLLAVVDGSNGNPICDPMFATVDANAPNPIAVAGVVPCDGTSGIACPGSPGEGQPGPCRFELTGLGSGSVEQLEVSAPGYLPSDVSNVTGGVGGCVPYSPPSQVTVGLNPAPSDGGVDSD